MSCAARGHRGITRYVGVLVSEPSELEQASWVLDGIEVSFNKVWQLGTCVRKAQECL